MNSHANQQAFKTTISPRRENLIIVGAK